MFHDPPLRRTKLSLKLFYQIELTLTSYIGLSAQAAVMHCLAHPKQPLIDILLIRFIQSLASMQERKPFLQLQSLALSMLMKSVVDIVQIPCFP